MNEQKEHPKITEGRRRADLVAEFFGWEVEGFGYPSEAVHFTCIVNGSAKDMRIDKQTMDALIAYIEKERQKS